MGNIQSKIIELRELINQHNFNYYVLNNPLINDYDYDLLLNQLVELEKKYPEYYDINSPTQKVGSDLSNQFETITHNIPMLSLSNSYDINDLLDFDRKVKEVIGGNKKIEYISELKIDGLSVSIIYKNYMLQKAITRGDGTQGEDVTNNVRTIKSLPLVILPENQIEGFSGDFEVRGEIFIKSDDFIKLNEERLELGEKLFANPRNLASGTIKLMDSREVSKRPLDIFLYYFYQKELEITEQLQGLEILKKLGFKVNLNYRLNKDINEVFNYCEKWENKRENLDYEIDGIVIKINNLSYQNELGYISKSPKWATAFKFKPKQVNTILKKIIWQVGRTGQVTPVAELDPVFLAGSTISRATLHNFEEIKRKNFKEGDLVIIEKGGDVIPKIVGVSENNNNQNSEFPKEPINCPVCNSILEKPENEVAIYCINYNCPSQIKRRIEHFTSRQAMDIEGLGESIINIFVEKKIINKINDIYYLKNKKNELVEMERFGEKSIENLINSIERSKEKSFDKVLYALGIRYVGVETARKLAYNFKTIDNLILASKERLEEVNEVGPRVSKSILDFFENKENLFLIEDLKKNNLNFDLYEVFTDDLFKSLSFVITGTLINFTRENIKEQILKLGGILSSSVSKKTSYVVVGENPGSKYQKAIELGVKILTEDEFINLIKDQKND